jgi:two-component system, cell cycle sensor histidine kinase and response regulator CckA
MNQQIFLTYILGLSVAIQTAAAFTAFRLIGITGRRGAWGLISGALLLMAARRLIALYYTVSGVPNIGPDILNESLGLVLSMMMFLGIARIGPIFIERRKAEESLKESEEKMRLLTETAVDAITMIDGNGAIEYWNPAAERIFGYSSHEAIGKSLHLLLAPERYHDRFLKGFERFRQTGQGPAIGNILELEAVRKGGTEIPVEVSFSVLLLKEERHAIGIMRDISERKEAEAERKKLEAQLRQSQKMEAIGTLTGGIAHDFNNILTAIIGFSTLVKMKLQDNDPLHSNVDNILAASDRAANLTRSMLAFCRKQVMTRRPVDLNVIIRNVENFLSRVIGEDVELKTQLTGSSWNILADSVQIEQVLMNLATNARDAMPHGGTLNIETSCVEIEEEFISRHGYGTPGAYTVLSMSDTGGGMDEDTAKRIYEPFFTTKPVGKGTGLGLSVVYGIVKQHDGFITCYSERGKGTTFRVYLPIIKEEAESSQATTGVPVSRGSETILLVEDDGHVRTPIRLYLENYGYRIIEAVDGEDGVNQFIANENKIDLALIDVIMPRLNGREVFRRIRERKPEIRVVFMSGYTADILQQEELVEEGVNILMKPAVNRELLKTIRNLLDQ